MILCSSSVRKSAGDLKHLGRSLILFRASIKSLAHKEGSQEYLKKETLQCIVKAQALRQAHFSSLHLVIDFLKSGLVSFGGQKEKTRTEKS